jgi:hypothetical protein
MIPPYFSFFHDMNLYTIFPSGADGLGNDIYVVSTHHMSTCTSKKAKNKASLLSEVLIDDA